MAKLDKKLKKNKTDVKMAKARDEMAKDLEVPITTWLSVRISYRYPDPNPDAHR